MVVRLLFHQGPVKWDGFDIRTGHSQRAAQSVLDRLKKQFVAANGEATKDTAIGEGIKKPNGKKSGKVKSEVNTSDSEQVQNLKAAGKKSKKEKNTETQEEVEAAEAGSEKKKRERHPSKKATEARSSETVKSKTPAPEASTEAKSKKRSKSKTPGAEPAGKKAKTEAEA